MNRGKLLGVFSLMAGVALFSTAQWRMLEGDPLTDFIMRVAG